METNKIYQGDTLTELKKFPDEYIDLVITSPPYYGLRRYGDYKEQIGLEKTFEEYLKKILEITAEIKRVLKPTGQFWLNMGDCYGGNMSWTEEYANKKQWHPKNPIKRKFGGNIKTSTLTNPESLLNKGRSGNQKCMLMQPERLAIKMIDEQGWILRNKIKWAKQVLIYKEKKTKGSVMPTSVKDRFNESGEELYFFVKNKKYYSDLDAVRLKLSDVTLERLKYDWKSSDTSKLSKGITAISNNGFNKAIEKMRVNVYGDKFNYRVRDAKRKAGQPQFKASEEEIKNYSPADHRGKNDITEKNYGLNRYSKGSEYEQKYGEPWDRFGENTNKSRTGRKANNPELGNRNFMPYRKRNSPEKLKSMGVPATYIGATGEDHNLLNNPAGKNLPTIWLIGSEPHNFQRELGSEITTDHFAIFPQALVEIPIKFGSSKGGLVLDPFMGSGTVALVAKKLGRNYIGIELNLDYIKIAEKRIAAIPQSLFK